MTKIIESLTMKTLAIIPAYNEEDCLVGTIKLLKEELPQQDFLIVDDGSSDNTKQICIDNNYPYISLPVNTGLTSAFQAGMKYAYRNNYDAAYQFDADGQHLPSYLPKMAQAMIDNDADIVIASRFINGEKPTGARGVGSNLISSLIKQTTGIKIYDPTSGLRLYSRRLIKLYAEGFDITPEPDTVALLVRHGAKVVEIPAEMQERQGGESYLNLPNIIAYMSRTCMSLILFQWFR